MKKYVFIRDDDVYKYNKKFLNLFNLFKKHKIPVIYGVIPKLVEKKLVNFLNKEKNLNPQLLDITQHGWSHKNYSKDLKNKYEFGSSRTYFQQKQDIQKGYLKMKRLFGKNFTPAFIPPYHGYNLTTLKIVNELKIPIFSAGEKFKIRNKCFFGLPAEISLNDYDKEGKPLTTEVTVMIKRFLKSLGQNKNMEGLVFHHRAIKNNKDFRKIKIFLLFLKRLEEEKRIKMILFSQYLSKITKNYT